MDLAGKAYVPLYVDLAPVTRVVAGHPIIAGPEGKELFITATLRRLMLPPGLAFATQAVTLASGTYVVIQQQWSRPYAYIIRRQLIFALNSHIISQPRMG